MNTLSADPANKVPISRYLNTRYAYCPSISSDGQRVAFVTDITGVSQAWQVPYHPGADAPGWPEQLTFQADRVMGLWCSPAPGDDRLVYTRDVGGNENAQIYLYCPGDGAHREAEYGSLETDREFLESISPINHLDKIAAPLIVIHGANDPRVPLSEAEQLVAALTARGISTEFIVFDDEGHGIAKLKNKLVAYPAIADFLDRVLQMR